MKLLKNAIVLITILLSPLFAQSAKINIKNPPKFIFTEKIDGNQLLFSSSTPLEDFTGTASSITGEVSFDPSDFVKSIKGKVSVKVKSINTGIELRNKHLRGKDWLNEPKFPDILFELKSISDFKQSAENKLSFKAKGDFTLHGVSKEITAVVDAIFIAESDQTKKRAAGDLLGLTTNFAINLSDFKVDNSLVGNKVAEKIEIKVTLIGSNK